MKSLRVISLTATLMSLVLMSAVAASQAEGASAPDPAPAPAAMEEKASGADHVPIHTPDAPLSSYQESPVLAALVAAGELPPVEERLPDIPAVVTPYDRIGKHGGTLKAPDGLYTNFRYITRYLNEGLYDITAPSGTTMYANIAESLDISDDFRTFTVHLRPGLKWSDGAPVTAADVMFTVNDIHLFVEEGADVTKFDVAPREFKVGGELLEFEVVDDYTIVVRAAEPFVSYKQLFATTRLDPTPAHYLKQFHPSYTESDKAPSEMITEIKQIHLQYLDPARPTLGAWMPTTVKEGDIMLLDRNPYYGKVDPEGNQLPYFDELHISYFKDQEVLKLRVIAGEFDWGSGNFGGDTIIFQNQERGNYRMMKQGGSFFVSAQVNLHWASREHEEPQDRMLADLLKNPKFLRALQLGIDNEQIAAAMVGPELVRFTGISDAHPLLYRGAVVGDSPESEATWEFLRDWLRYDPDEANAILDELGLAVGDDGYRHYPSGERVEMSMGYFDRSYMHMSEVVAMQGDKWDQELKIKVFGVTRPWSPGYRELWLQGTVPLVEMGAGWGHWAVNDLNFNQLYQRGVTEWVESGGSMGEEPHDGVREPLEQMYELIQEYQATPDPEQRRLLAVEATDIAVRNLVAFPLVLGGSQSTLLFHNRLQNVVEGGWPGFASRRTIRIEQWFAE